MRLFLSRQVAVRVLIGLLDVPVQLSQVVEWSVEFGPTPKDCGIWVKTESEVWYRLLSPNLAYASYFLPIHNSSVLFPSLFLPSDYHQVHDDYQGIFRPLRALDG